MQVTILFVFNVKELLKLILDLLTQYKKGSSICYISNEFLVYQEGGKPNVIFWATSNPYCSSGLQQGGKWVILDGNLGVTLRLMSFFFMMCTL